MIADKNRFFAEQNWQKNLRRSRLADFVDDDQIKRLLEVLVVPCKFSRKRGCHAFDVDHSGVHRLQIVKHRWLGIFEIVQPIFPDDAPRFICLNRLPMFLQPCVAADLNTGEVQGCSGLGIGTYVNRQGVQHRAKLRDGIVELPLSPFFGGVVHLDAGLNGFLCLARSLAFGLEEFLVLW